MYFCCASLVIYDNSNIGVRIVNRNVPMELDITIKARWFRLIRPYTINMGGSINQVLTRILGKETHMAWIPQGLRWKSEEDTLSYAFTIGRNLLLIQNPKTLSIITKWHVYIPLRLKLKHGISTRICTFQT